MKNIKSSIISIDSCCKILVLYYFFTPAVFPTPGSCIKFFDKTPQALIAQETILISGELESIPGIQTFRAKEPVILIDHFSDPSRDIQLTAIVTKRKNQHHTLYLLKNEEPEPIYSEDIFSEHIFEKINFLVGHDSSADTKIELSLCNGLHCEILKNRISASFSYLDGLQFAAIQEYRSIGRVASGHYLYTSNSKDGVEQRRAWVDRDAEINDEKLAVLRLAEPHWAGYRKKLDYTFLFPMINFNKVTSVSFGSTRNDLRSVVVAEKKMISYWYRQEGFLKEGVNTLKKEKRIYGPKIDTEVINIYFPEYNSDNLVIVTKNRVLSKNLAKDGALKDLKTFSDASIEKFERTLNGRYQGFLLSDGTLQIYKQDKKDNGEISLNLIEKIQVEGKKISTFSFSKTGNSSDANISAQERYDNSDQLVIGTNDGQFAKFIFSRFDR